MSKEHVVSMSLLDNETVAMSNLLFFSTCQALNKRNGSV